MAESRKNPGCRARYQFVSGDGRASRMMEWECSQMNISGMCSDSEIRAHNIACQAEMAYSRGRFSDAINLVNEALNQYPICADALRLLCKLTPRNSQGILHGHDEDTIVQSLRECLFFLRPHYEAILEKSAGHGRDLFRLMPLVRFLNAFTSPTIMIGKIEVCIHALEEILRIDHEDHTFARENLLLCYLTVVGRAHRREVVFIDRGESDVRALMNCHFDGHEFPLFDTAPSTGMWYNEDLMVLGWANILMCYKNHDTRWTELAKEQETVCPWLMKFLFDEVPKVLKGSGNNSIQDNANRIAERLALCLFDWPMFMCDLYEVLRGRKNKLMEEKVIATAPGVFSTVCRETKPARARSGLRLLEQGREWLRECRYVDAVNALTVAQKCFAACVFPDSRWYLVAPFPIAANRALAAERLKQWNMCRVDTRITLAKQNNHIKSYERMPIVMATFGALELARELGEFVVRLKYGTHPAAEWSSAAAYAIGMLSISAIMMSKMGVLTEMKKRELIKIGLDEMHTGVNIGEDVMDNLPWLDESRLDVQ